MANMIFIIDKLKYLNTTLETYENSQGVVMTSFTIPGT